MSTHQRFPLGTSLLLVCLGAGSLAAQDGRPMPSEATLNKPQTFEQRLESLRKEFQTAERAARDAMRKAKTPAEQAAAMEINPWATLSERFDELAFEAEGTQAAAGAWATIFTNEVRYGDLQKAQEAFGVLVYDHSDSSELESVVSTVRYAGMERGLALDGLRHLADASPLPSVRAGSLFTLANLLEEKEGTREEALGHYRTILAQYADVDAGRGSTFGEKAVPAIYEAENLQVGMSVPDMESLDETSTPFKLSDYEGKVVLLDFWGFW